MQLIYSWEITIHQTQVVVTREHDAGTTAQQAVAEFNRHLDYWLDCESVVQGTFNSTIAE